MLHHRLRAKGLIVPAGDYNPPTTNLLFDFNPGKSGTVTLVSSAVSSMANDSAGAAGALAQATGGARPTIAAADLNGFDVCSHTTAQWLKTPSFTWAQPATYYLVLKLNWGNQRYIFDGNSVNSSVLWTDGSSPQTRMYAGTLANANTGLAHDAWGVMCCVFNGASSISRVNNNSDVTGNPGTSGPGGLTIGARSDGVNPGGFKWARVFGYAAAHDDTARDGVITDLLSFYGL